MAPKKDGRKCPRKPRFQEGDRVLCFHGPFLYKAECMKVSVKYRKVKYQVRYFGVKGRTYAKAEVAKQLSSLQAPDACEPSTSEAAETVVVLTSADVWDAGVASRGRPSPQADWEDEWLPQSKLLKYNKANLRKLRELNRAKQGQAAEGTVAGPVTREKASALQRKNDETAGVTMQKAKTVRRQIIRSTETHSTDVKPARGRGRPPGRRRRRWRRRRKSLLLPRKKRRQVTCAAYSDSDSDVEPNEDFFKKTETKVRIPEELKPWLLDDWDMVVRQNQLFLLPAKKNVDSILEDYERYERISANADDEWMKIIREFVVGIKAYFDVMLGSQLLYKFERPQYAEILANLPGVPMSQVYGAPHLLRLFVKVEKMLTYTPLEEQRLALLLQHLHIFLHYLANNFSDLFSSSEYDVASPEYYRKAF